MSASAFPAGPAEERRFFDSAACSLYGALYRGVRPGAPLVLFCNAFAENYSEWRAEVIGARMIAERGYPAFSYHPRAHGDSTGNPEEMTFEGLVDDAMAAADHALRRSGASRLVWVGIRFGALVAAEAMRRRRDAVGLALWEPVITARDHFRKLMRHVLYYELSQGHRPSMTVDQMTERLDREGKVALLGFDLYRKFNQSVIEADLARNLENWRGPTLIAQFQRHSGLSRDHRGLKRILERRGAQVRAALFTSEPGSDSGGDPWLSPEDLARQMGEWLDGLG